MNDAFSLPPKAGPYFGRILDVIDHSKFVIPQEYSLPYYPDFLESTLDEWVNYYEAHYMRIFQWVHWLPNQVQWQSMLESIKDLSESIKESVHHFYSGNILKATGVFNASLDKALYKDIFLANKVSINTSFYRARCGGNTIFRKADLFHVPFEKRQFIGTNRYSIPGLPALYLGGSAHICWAELNQPKFRDLQYSRLENKRELTTIRIQRLDDFLETISPINDDDEKLAELSKYLITYPLTIACTIKVREPNGNFKPEYIIPQLLLQYVSEHKDIAGIMYPSTKIDYTTVKDIPSYNYIFPVKSNKKEGFCPILADSFVITEPTSLEIEEIIYNRKYQAGIWMPGDPGKGRLELSKGVQSVYRDTAFGRVEQALRLKMASSVNSV